MINTEADMSTIQTIPQLPSSPAGPVPIPVLEQGDHLTREEFHRRYEAMPHGVKAELIEGVVHMPSPVNYKQHSKQHFDLIAWLGYYVALTPDIEGGDNATLKLDLKNEPQPDAFLIIPPKLGGQVRFDDKGYIIGAPEWIGEVSASSASYDLHSKIEAYRRNGVKEYVVWRVLDRAIDWFVLVGEKFQRLDPTPEGWYKSRELPGLWLDVPALLDGQLLKAFQLVQQGAATAEHQQFVRELQQRSQGSV
jgi:Uma2 family endonuclease